MRGGPRPNLFVCLRLNNPQLVARLGREQERLQNEGVVEARDAIVPQKFHITLALCRAGPESQAQDVQRLVSAMTRAGTRTLGFTLGVQGLGSFGTRVVFAKGREEENVRNLAKAITEAIKIECGELLVEEDREFSPHATLFKQSGGGGGGGGGRRRASSREEREEAQAKKLKLEQAIAASQGDLFGEQLVDQILLCPIGAFGGPSVASLPTAPGEYPVFGAAPLVRFDLFADAAFAEQPLRFETALRACQTLEAASYPSDEAASPERMAQRAKECPELFGVATVGAERVVGFVNGTAAALAADGLLPHDAMGEHDPAGQLLCIHSVVVDPELRRSGFGSIMLQKYVERVRGLNKHKRIALLSKEHLLGFYQKAGFKVIGPSAVHHGQEQWFDCVLDV